MIGWLRWWFEYRRWLRLMPVRGDYPLDDVGAVQWRVVHRRWMAERPSRGDRSKQ